MMQYVYYVHPCREFYKNKVWRQCISHIPILPLPFSLRHTCAHIHTNINAQHTTHWVTRSVFLGTCVHVCARGRLYDAGGFLDTCSSHRDPRMSYASLLMFFYYFDPQEWDAAPIRLTFVSISQVVVTSSATCVLVDVERVYSLLTRVGVWDHTIRNPTLDTDDVNGLHSRCCLLLSSYEDE